MTSVELFLYMKGMNALMEWNPGSKSIRLRQAHSKHEVGIRAPLPLFLRLRRREAGRKLDHPSASDCSFAKESK